MDLLSYGRGKHFRITQMLVKSATFTSINQISKASYAKGAGGRQAVTKNHSVTIIGSST